MRDRSVFGLTSKAKTENVPTGMLMIANVISKFLGFGLLCQSTKPIRSSQCLSVCCYGHLPEEKLAATTRFVCSCVPHWIDLRLIIRKLVLFFNRLN